MCILVLKARGGPSLSPTLPFSSPLFLSHLSSPLPSMPFCPYPTFPGVSLFCKSSYGVGRICTPDSVDPVCRVLLVYYAIIYYTITHNPISTANEDFHRRPPPSDARAARDASIPQTAMTQPPPLLPSSSAPFPFLRMSGISPAKKLWT